jgi:hypothetical protein
MEEKRVKDKIMESERRRQEDGKRGCEGSEDQ